MCVSNEQPSFPFPFLFQILFRFCSESRTKVPKCSTASLTIFSCWLVQVSISSIFSHSLISPVVSLLPFYYYIFGIKLIRLVIMSLSLQVSQTFPSSSIHRTLFPSSSSSHPPSLLPPHSFTFPPSLSDRTDAMLSSSSSSSSSRSPLYRISI